MKPIIRVENLSKKYKLGESKQPYSTLRESLVKTLKSPFKSFQKSDAESSFWALKDINFEIFPGEVVGIIGRNGAGKSTLLKVLSRITEPTNGKIELYGRVASLLEVGTGFHPELTGRENVFLNGAILGMRREEIARKFDEIVDFAEVEKFIDTPVKRYSSGMYVRLAFAVAAYLEPEVLVVDEVLAVGDSQFQKKCLGKMQDVSSQGRTVLFVSHNLSAIKQLCNRGILLRKGMIDKVGDVLTVSSYYQQNQGIGSNYKANQAKGDISIEEVYLTNNQMVKENQFYHNQSINIYLKINNKSKNTNNSFLLVRFFSQDGIAIFSCETEIKSGKDNYHLNISDSFLVKGMYYLNCIIYKPAICQFDNIEECCEFEILDNISEFSHLETFDIGKVYLRGHWS